MPKLTIDTKDSLFDPIEIAIDGETFVVNRLTRPLLLKIEELMKAIQGGSFDAGFRVLELLLGEKAFAVISELDLTQVNKISKFITGSITQTTDEEKNGSKPGDKVSHP